MRGRGSERREKVRDEEEKKGREREGRVGGEEN